MMNAAEIKKSLRRYCNETRMAIPADTKRVRDLDITHQLLKSDFYADVQEVLCYVSTNDEIDTMDFINCSLRDGKAVFVPRCMEQRGVMKFYRIRSVSDLKIGKYGIMEPDCVDDDEWRCSDKKALCVVPALCCDGAGNRLGYGGGYYDRFLSEFDGFTVCLCYRELSDVELPLEQYDVPCKMVIKG